MRAASTLLCLVLIQLLFAQTTFYVHKATGDDANDGLSDTTAWKTVQKAFDSATPGSTVLIRTGPYYEHPVLNVSGAPGQPITFTNYPGESATIDGDSALGNTIVTIEDRHDVILRNLRIQNMYTPGATGLLIRATPSGGVSNITITRCRVRWLGWTDDAALAPGPGDLARPILVLGEGTDAANSVTGLRLDSLSVNENFIGQSEAIRIDGNVSCLVNECDVFDNTNTGILFGGGHGVSADPIWDNAKGAIERSRFWSNKSLYLTSAGIRIDGADFLGLYANKCWDNGHGIEIGCSQDGYTGVGYATNNLVFQNRKAGLVVGGFDTLTTGEVLNWDFRNNTLIENDRDTTGVGEVLLGKVSDTRFSNNLIHASGQGILLTRGNIVPQSGNSFYHNAWYAEGMAATDVRVIWGTDTLEGFTDYVNISGWEAGSFYADPVVVDAGSIEPDAHLQDDSPCINAGDPLTMVAPTETDFAGAPRIVNDTIDVGAFEWQEPSAIMERTPRSVFVSPNPTYDVARIDAPFRIARMEVRDVQGRLLIEHTDGSPVLSLVDVAAGVYPLLVTGDGGERLAARIVKH